MKNIREFKSHSEFLKFAKPQLVKYLASGSEGDVFLTKSGDIIKVMTFYYEQRYLCDCQDAIFSNELQLDSFIFPDELYVVDGLIVGYREKYFENDLFHTDLDMNYSIENLIKAREKFIEDTKVLTEHGYQLFDLARNILFDNNKLVAIDTLDYVKKNVSLQFNIGAVDYAILTSISDCCPNIDVRKPFEEEIQKVYTKK